MIKLIVTIFLLFSLQTVLSSEGTKQLLNIEMEDSQAPLSEFKGNKKCTKATLVQNFYYNLEQEKIKFEKNILGSDDLLAKQMSAIIGLNRSVNDKTLAILDKQTLNNLRIDNLSRLVTENPNSQLINYHYLDACLSNTTNINCSAEKLTKSKELGASKAFVKIKVNRSHSSSKNSKIVSKSVFEYVLAEDVDTVLEACLANKEESNCSAGRLAKTKAQDHSNGTIWAKLARIHIINNDIKAAVEAIEQAGRASAIDELRKQRMALFLSVLELSDISHDKHFLLALDYDLGSSPQYTTHISDFCVQHSLVRNDVLNACLNYGRRLEKDGNTNLSMMIGLNLLLTIYELLDDDESFSYIQSKKAELRELMDKNNTDIVFFTFDKALQNFWLSAMKDNNEYKTFQLVKEETKRRGDVNYTDCSYYQ